MESAPTSPKICVTLCRGDRPRSPGLVLCLGGYFEIHDRFVGYADDRGLTGRIAIRRYMDFGKQKTGRMFHAP